MVIDPVREEVLEFGATLKITVPFPLPVPLDVRVIQEELLTATHVQPLGANTLTLPPPAPLEKEAKDGEIENEQGMPACETVKV